MQTTANTFTLEENERESKRLYALLDSGVREQLMQFEGVQHVGLGLKIKNEQVVWERSFHVYVNEKKAPEQLLSSEWIPTEIAGVLTDVHEVPQVELLMSVCEDFTKREKITGGIPISNGYENSMGGANVGTIAAIGKDNATCVCRTLALTNWHVLYATPPQPNGQTKPVIGSGTRIFHPAAVTTIRPNIPLPLDGVNWDPVPDPNTEENDIGKVLDGAFTEVADVGVFEINRYCSNCCGVSCEDKILGLDAVSPITHDGVQGRGRANIGDLVFFRGATSGPSKGYVVSDDATVTITFPGAWVCDPRVTIGADGLVRRTFVNQLKIRTDGTHICNKNAPKPQGYTGPDFSRFVDHGDSGALLVNSANMAVGLIFASDSPLHASPPNADMYPVPTPTPSGVPPLPADCAPFTLYGYANHYDAVMDVVHNQLGIDFEIRYKQKPATGTSGEAVSVSSPFEEQLAKWKERAEEFPKSKLLYSALQQHRNEVLHLVNHCRPVTVVWQRNQGPAFTALVLDALQNEIAVLPHSHKGITIQQLAERMHQVLLEKGSEQLRNDLQLLGPSVFAALDNSGTVDELLLQFSVS